MKRRVLAPLLAASLLSCGCGGGVQRATVLPQTASVPAVETGEHWNVVKELSRFDVVGVDVMGGRHPIAFDRWEATVITGAQTRVLVEVDVTSARASSELTTQLLKDELLEAHRYPRATLVATLRPSRRGGDQQIVEGNLTLHGVEKGVRFRGELKKEGAHYRFFTRFRISRDAFGIRAKAAWDSLVKDDVHVTVDVVAAAD